MSTKKSGGNNDHKANQNNPNKGNPGVNDAFAKNQGNRGKQLNPNQKKGK